MLTKAASGGQRIPTTAPETPPRKPTIAYAGTLEQRQALRDFDNVERQRRIARALRLRGI